MKFFLFIVIFVSYLVYFERINKDRTIVCTDLRTVAEVGGCHRYECGVKFTDGTFGEVRSPVVGKRYCFKYRSTKPWRYI